MTRLKNIFLSISVFFIVSCNPLGGSEQGSRIEDGYLPTYDPVTGASATTSTISATSNITADGVSLSVVTITLLDLKHRPVVGITPTVDVTGSNNTIGTCSVTNASGVSTCNLSSTKAETKTVALTSPVSVTGNSVVFVAGPPASIAVIGGASQSEYRGTTLPTAFEVEVKDAQNNVISGQPLTWSVTAGNGSLSIVSTTTDVSGKSSSTLTLGTTPGTNTVTVSIVSPALSTTISATGTTIALTNNIWNFNTTEATNYVLSNSSLELSTTNIHLKSSDRLDQDGSALGFGGGTFKGVVWDSVNSVIKLGSSSGCDASLSNCSELDLTWMPKASSLIGLWHMNEKVPGTAPGGADLIDYSGQGNHLSRSAGTVTYGLSGKINTSVLFNGSGNYSLTNTSLASRPTGNTFSMSAWVKRTASNSVGPIIRNSNQIVGFGVTPCSAANQVKVTKFSVVDICLQPFPTDTQWHHLAVVYSSIGVVLYVDGQSVATSTNNQNFTTATTGYGTMYLGGGQGIFSGNIDEVAMWSSALTAQDVMLIYSKQSAKYAGSFYSRIFDGFDTSATWTKLNWKTSLPFYKSLSTANELKTDYSSLVDSAGTSNDSSLATGLIGLWHLDEVSGSNSITNSVNQVSAGTLNGITFGNTGLLSLAARYATASNSYIYYPLQLNIPKTTVSVFVKLNSYPSTGFARLFGLAQGNGGTIHDKTLYIDSAGKFRFYVFDTSSKSTSLSTNAIPLGVWTHLVGTADGTVAKAYMNGNLEGSVAADNTYTSYTGNNVLFGGYTVGGYAGSSTVYMDGLLDEAAIWNRALNVNEIKMLYRRGANRVKFQVRSCTASDCSDDATEVKWKGPDGTPATYYSELNNVTGSVVNSVSPVMTFANFTSPQASSNRYFQYRVVLESDDASTSPDVQYVKIDPTHYDSSSPNVITKVGVDYYSLSSVLPTLGTNSCAAGIKYNLGRGATYASATWYYWNGSAWIASGGTELTANLVAELNTAVLDQFTKEGKVYLKAFLKSDGTSPCELQSFKVDGVY